MAILQCHTRRCPAAKQLAKPLLAINRRNVPWRAAACGLQAQPSAAARPLACPAVRRSCLDRFARLGAARTRGGAAMAAAAAERGNNGGRAVGRGPGAPGGGRQQRQPSPQQLSTRIKDCTSLQELQDLVVQYGSIMNHINVAAAISKLPKVWDGQQRPSADAATQLLQRLLGLLEADGGALAGQLGVWGLANCIWAVAKLYEAGMEAAPHEVTRAALLLLMGHLSTAAASGLLAAEAVPQALSNIAWALAKAAPLLADKAAEVKQLLDAIAEAVARRGLKGFKPQELSNLAWAYAKAGLGQQHGRLFAAIAAAVDADNMLTRFKPQELSNLAWAYATAGLGQQHGRLFAAIAVAVLAADTKLAGFDPQELSSLAWAYAKAGLGQQHGRLLRRIAAAAESSVDRSFTPQNLAILIWALAKSDVYEPRLFEAVARHSCAMAAAGQLKQFESQNISNAAYAYALVRHYDAALLSALVEEACGRQLAGFNSQEVSNLLWALAQLNHEAGGAEHAAQCLRLCSMVQVQLLESHSGLLEQGVNAQEVCNTAWALAALGHPISSGLMARLLEAADQLLARQDLVDEELVQLFYAAHLVPSLQAGGRTPLQQRAQLFLASEAACRSQVQQCCSEATSINDVHRDVHAVLTKASAGGDGLGLQAQMEQPTADGYFAVDNLVSSYRGQQVAVEVDGPSHFAANDPQHEMGGTVLRNRLLRRRLPLACIRVDEWVQLSPTQRAAWLRTQLNTAVQQWQQTSGQHPLPKWRLPAAGKGRGARSSGASSSASPSSLSAANEMPATATTTAQKRPASAMPTTRSGTPLPLKRQRRPLPSQHSVSD